MIIVLENPPKKEHQKESENQRETPKAETEAETPVSPKAETEACRQPRMSFYATRKERKIMYSCTLCQLRY